MIRLLLHAVFLLTASAPLMLPTIAHAQSDWQFFPRPSFPRVARAAVVHDGELIVGGYFTSIHQVDTRHVAKWNGRAWEAVGQASSSVNELATSGGSLFYGSAPFVSDNEGDISRFDGSSWTRVGTLTVVDDYVRIDAMIDLGGTLVVSGRFDAVDGLPVNGIAAFDGSAWSAVGSGPGVPGTRITALAIHGQDLVAAGDFTIAGGGFADRIARWNGSTWLPVGNGLPDPAQTLVEFDGDLWAGFATSATTAEGSEVRRWDGSAWVSAGDGVIDLCGFFASFTSSRSVLDFGVHDGQLYLGGTFTTGFTSDGAIAGTWNGSSWERLGFFGGEAEDFAGNYFVGNVVSLDGRAVLAGFFPSTGVESIENIAAWNGSGFERVADDETGLDNTAYDMAVGEGGVIVGGNFDEAGIVSTGPVALWDGFRWNALGLLPTDRIHGQVFAVTVEGSDVYVGGEIILPGGAVVDVARFDGNGWSGLGVDGEAPTNDLIWFDGSLVAATSDRVRRWDGTSWSFLGSMPAGAYVTALAVYDGKLHAATTFGVPDTPQPDVFRLDGDQWTSIAPTGTYSSGWAFALTAHAGSLVLGGGFQGIGEVASPRVISWDGTTWSARSTSIDRDVRALASTSQGLVIGGTFRSVDGSDIRGFALEDPQLGWISVPGSPTSSVFTMLPRFGSLWIGGGFSGSADGSSARVMVWHPNLATNTELPVTPKPVVVDIVPNPFNPSTALQFEIVRSGAISVEVFDVAGRLVRTVLVDVAYGPGRHSVSWDGRDDTGMPVASGVYVFRVASGPDVAMGKMTLVK